jgi:hypothetical protein
MLTLGKNAPCRHYLRPDDPQQPGTCERRGRFLCEEAMKHKLPSISYSSLQDFIQCKEKYHHRVIKGLRVKPEHLPAPVKLGRAWDTYLNSVHGHKETDHLDLHLTPIQQAQINALTRAYRDLEITLQKSGLLGCQYKIHVTVGQNQIIGVVDRAHDDHVVETKLSSRPDFYRQRENLTYQLGTYFMGNDAWDYADVEITRVPGLQTGKGKYSDETPDAYEARCYSDVISRPAYYFQGWDRKTRTYGVRFWRSEFDRDEIYRTYVHVLWEIQDTVTHGSWYPNYLACYVPAPCQYLPIKKTGVISSEIFEQRQKEKVHA